jgi:hypothetical protein
VVDAGNAAPITTAALRIEAVTIFVYGLTAAKQTRGAHRGGGASSIAIVLPLIHEES